MNLVRFNPGFSSLFDSLEKTNNLFNDSHGDVPSVNIQDNEKDFVIEVAAPGVKKDEFNIKVENNVLSISREVKENKEEKKDNYTRREFVYSSFNRTFTLPKIVDVDKIDADYNQGILSITLPKKEEAVLSREIKIK
jgi:HSP20 family protein